MASVKESIKVKATADAIWKFVGDYDGLHRWHPLVAGSTGEKTGGGRLRHLTLKDGVKLTEKLVKLDDTGHFYTYAMVDMGPLPLARYQSTLAVKANPDGKTATVEWQGSFEPKGQPADAVAKLVATIYQAGFGAIAAKFGAG